MDRPTEPTSEQCETHAKVFRARRKVGYAIWYPQMGGHVGRAVAVLDEEWTSGPTGDEGGCIDVYVWHDGEFPFSEQAGPPKLVHHCDPEQFIRFGQTLTELNAKGRIDRTGV